MLSDLAVDLVRGAEADGLAACEAHRIGGQGYDKGLSRRVLEA